jgi:small subunit ribosomal protein S1
MIKSIDDEKNRIGLSTRWLEPNPGDMIHNRQEVFDNAERMAELWR